MSEQRLPLTIAPTRFAKEQTELSGDIALAELSRLQAPLSHTRGIAHIELSGGVDQQGLCYLIGSVTAEVSLQCQRCMQDMTVAIQSKLCLSPVTTIEEAEQLPSHYEALMVSEPEVAVAQLIEDEILLNLPLVARHETADCHMAEGPKRLDSESDQPTGPFSVLADLM